MEVFSTKSFTDEYRTEEHNGARQFSECEHCGIKHSNCDWIGIVYRHRYKQILCDRCTDNHDRSTVWTDEYAAKNGLPPYPPREYRHE